MTTQTFLSDEWDRLAEAEWKAHERRTRHARRICLFAAFLSLLAFVLWQFAARAGASRYDAWSEVCGQKIKESSR